MTHDLWRDLKTERYGHGCDGRGGGWPGLRQVILVRIRTEYISEPGSPVEEENHYYLTSLSHLRREGSPQALLEEVRRHWDIENKLHHVKDRTMREDDSRTKRGAVNMCWLRNLAVTLMPFLEGESAAQKAIHVAANPKKVLRLIKAKRLRRCKTNN